MTEHTGELTRNQISETFCSYEFYRNFDILQEKKKKKRNEFYGFT